MKSSANRLNILNFKGDDTFDGLIILNKSQFSSFLVSSH